MLGGVFICYRREETAFSARDLLSRRLDVGKQGLDRAPSFCDADHDALVCSRLFDETGFLR
jgi:hypothetical protein